MLTRVRLMAMLGSVIASDLARAQPSTDVDLCAKALEKAGSVTVRRRDVTQQAYGNRHVVVGNTESLDGFVCLLAPSTAGLAVAELALGSGSVGTVSQVRRIELPTGPHLLTVQAFRGGSNATRLDYVLYRFDEGKIRAVLRLPYRRELAIGSYRLSEHNSLATGKSGLRGSQTMLLYQAEDERRARVLYKATRDFDLQYASEFRSFVEGVAVCTGDLVVQKKVWLKKGSRAGYLLQPGIAEAGGLAIRLVRADGIAVTLKEPADLVFLQLAPWATAQ